MLLRRTSTAIWPHFFDVSRFGTTVAYDKGKATDPVRVCSDWKKTWVWSNQKKDWTKIDLSPSPGENSCQENFIIQTSWQLHITLSRMRQGRGVSARGEKYPHPALLPLPSGMEQDWKCCWGTQERGTKHRCLKPYQQAMGFSCPAPSPALSSRIQQPRPILKAKLAALVFFSDIEP